MISWHDLHVCGGVLILLRIAIQYVEEEKNSKGFRYLTRRMMMMMRRISAPRPRSQMLIPRHLLRKNRGKLIENLPRYFRALQEGAGKVSGGAQRVRAGVAALSPRVSTAGALDGGHRLGRIRKVFAVLIEKLGGYARGDIDLDKSTASVGARGEEWRGDGERSI